MSVNEPSSSAQGQPGGNDRTSGGEQGSVRTDRIPAVALMALVAVTTAALGAGIGGWFGWRGGPVVPDRAEATAVFAEVLPGEKLQGLTRRDALFDYEPPSVSRLESLLTAVLGSDGYKAGGVDLKIGPVDDPAGLLSETRDRLEGAGWVVGAVQDDPGDRWRSFSAAHGDVVITLEIAERIEGRTVTRGSYSSTILMSVQRREPAGVRWLVIAGWTIGLALGLLLAWRVQRPAARVADRWSTLMVVSVVVGLMMLTPATGLTALAVVGYTFGLDPDLESLSPVWQPFMLGVLRPFCVLGFVALAVAVLWKWGTRRHRTRLPT